MVKQIKLRTDTEANFIAANTLLRNGELGIAICTDSTRKIKVGNGYTPWVDLPYTADMDKYDDILAGITEENENQETSLEHLEQALAELETDVAGIVEQQNQQGETLSALQNQETVQDDALRETIQVVSNHDGRLENLETQVASLEELPLTGETVLEIQQKDAEQDDRLDGIDGTLTEITQNIAQNQQKNTDQDADIQGLAESVSAFSEKILSFESAQGGYNNQFSTLAAKETEQDNRLSNLEAATASSSGASSDHTSRIDTLFDNLEAEIAARDGADREHDQAITDLTETYTQERIDRIDGDDALTQAVTELNEKIDQETAERTQADEALTQAVTELDEKIEQETAGRTQADEALAQTVSELDEKIEQETAERTQADTTLQDRITQHQADFEEHKDDTNNPHQVTKEQLGIDAVDNTADEDKPVSIAQAAAIAEALGLSKTYTDEQLAAAVAGTLHYKGTIQTYADLPITDNELFDLWAVLDTGNGYYWFNDEWNILDFTVNLGDYYQRTEVDALLAAIEELLYDKVSKEPGKGLSQNDFTNEYLQMLQATNGAMKVFHDEVDYTANEYHDVLVTRYMFESDLTLTNSFLEIIIEGVSFRVVATSATNLRTEVKAAVPGTTVVADIRRNTFYNSGVEGQTIQDYELNDTPYIIDATIYVASNDYSTYEIWLNRHWWEINLWPIRNKSRVVCSLERRM